MKVLNSRMKLFVFSLSLLIFKDVCGFSISVQPSKERVVQVGQELTILCQSGVRLGSCQFEVPKEGSLTISPISKEYRGITYFGEGLERGQCGLRLRDIKEHHNGEFKCRLTEEGSVPNFAETINVIVAVKPSSPTLAITRGREGEVYLEGETIVAVCKVERGRPPATITWFIGDDKITDGLSPPTVLDDRNLFTVSQNLTRKIQASDNGRALRCVAGHPFGMDRNSTQRQITVRFGPKSMSDPIEHFGLKEGEEVRISVVTMANPKPSFSWQVGQERIQEGDMDIAQRYHLLPATEKVEKGNGYWESVLVIKNLEKEDVEKNYVVTAHNRYGEQNYKVLISTNPEPKMLELGVGTIFLIIVAVLIILTLASLLVFARAKGRWCFAAYDRSNTKYTLAEGRTGPHLAGESSDTESADHQSKKPKMTFKAVFKKKNDKVATESAPESKDVTVKDDKTEEEGKLNPEAQKSVAQDEGVVYAELDLQANAHQGRSLLVRPEDDKTEYAEIIHSKENKK